MSRKGSRHRGALLPTGGCCYPSGKSVTWRNKFSATEDQKAVTGAFGWCGGTEPPQRGRLPVKVKSHEVRCEYLHVFICVWLHMCTYMWNLEVEVGCYLLPWPISIYWDRVFHWIQTLQIPWDWIASFPGVLSLPPELWNYKHKHRPVQLLYGISTLVCVLVQQALHELTSSPALSSMIFNMRNFFFVFAVCCHGLKRKGPA